MAYLSVDEDLVERFLSTLREPASPGRKKEQVVQDFLEANTELIPTFAPSGQVAHLKAVISKFKISQSLITDYAFMNKNSVCWDVTFVELEAPEKPFFTGNLDRICGSAKFNAALAQVEQWRSYVERNRSAVLRSLYPLMQGALRGNPVNFRYQLVYGRSKEKNRSADARDWINDIGERRGIRILSYDSLINTYRTSPLLRKNVMHQVGARYGFKSMLDRPVHVFSAMGPEHIHLTRDQVSRLLAEGYDMEAWQNGELLSFGHKLPLSKSGLTCDANPVPRRPST